MCWRPAPAIPYEFVERAFALIGRRLKWRGKGTHETGIDEASGKELVKV